MLAVPRIRKSLKELESYRTHGSGSLPDRDMQNPSILAIQRDSKNDSIFGARREMQRRRRHAPSRMGATELQSNWPEMQKTLGKPGFCSGEDRNRTTHKFPGKLTLRHHARREIRRAPISLFETTRNTIHRDQLATSLQPDLQGHEFKTDPNLQGHGFPFTGSFTGSHQKPLRIYRVTISIYRVKRTMTLIVFNLEALLVRLRRMGDSRWTQGKAEADVGGVDRRAET